MSTSITFVVTGQAQGGERGAAAALPQPTLGGTLKQSVRLTAERGAGDTLRLSAMPGEDVVLLHLGGGPSLVLHPETARDLLLGQGDLARAAGTPGEVTVPGRLRWRGLEQAAPTRGAGFLGDALLTGIDVVGNLLKDPAADLAASAVVAHVDGQVEAGVYRLQRQTLAALKDSGQRLDNLPAPPTADAPLLVLVHGTFVETVSTFGKLWAMHPQSVGQLFDFYGDRVYALDHATLGQSPIANALTLVRALPAGARLHLLTHSRGGLVAEVLARVAGQREIGVADLAMFPGAALQVQRDELQALAALVRERDVHVDRVVRVACPARGTLLASTRLDAYLSVLKWSLELAGVPLLPGFVEFLTEVARRRADPRLLPGLAAMMPDTPLVDWLNGAAAPIAGQLRVVAGDLQGDSVASWMKTLLADAFYWTDNDIVVQTRSMYGGTPRLGGASFLFDQGAKVTHFNYFVNPRTVDAVVGGLTQNEPAGFRAIGPLSWAGQDSGGLRGSEAPAPAPAADRPAVFLLPGILGSNLAADGRRVWLGLRLLDGLARLAFTGQPDGVRPDGPIGEVYDALIAHLGASHEVLPFAFDWRRPIEQEAQRLADAVDAALAVRQASGQPVRLLAHSMGGLLARTMQLERPDTWQRLMARDGARLLMLGTPNGGSWAPMQVLSGDDTFGNALVAAGSPLHDQQARQTLASMPGFLQLQILDGGLDRADTWQQLADQDLQRLRQVNWWHNYAGERPEAVYQWGVPPQAVLDQARQLRQRLDQQRDGPLKSFADKLLLVVGHAKFTPDGYEMGDSGLVYLDASDGGDGRVTIESALLPGVRTWTLDCEHGSLPGAADAFAAFDDLLLLGSTERLPPYVPPAAPAAPGAAPMVRVRSRPSRGRLHGMPPQSPREVFETGAARVDGADSREGRAAAALRVNVLNGDLSFVHQPLMVGHYRSLALTGTESVIDRLVGRAMSASLAAGLYPGQTGTHQIFANPGRDPDNPWRAPRPNAVLVVGLGDEGKLREQELTLSTRQATLAWAQRLAENPDGAATRFELAATLMGSGGIGIYAGSAARAIAQGVRDANLRLAAGGWPVVGLLTLVELYLERAADAWHGLQVLATASPGQFEIGPTVLTGTGPLRRQLDSGYRGTDYDFVTATTQSEGTIAFTLDSKRARSEVRAQVTQAGLVRELVQRASTSASPDPQIGRTLFQLLVPMEVEPFLGGTSHMLLELDKGTAPIPWELLDTSPERGSGGDQRPWAIRSQLLRKLRTDDFRQQVQDAASEDNVLVIGEPLADPAVYPRLPGALAEARAVARALAEHGGVRPERLTALLAHDDADRVINALYARRYRIVHIAGHGEPGMAGGVVLSGGTFLGPCEIRSMRTVPEMVFVNCCHLAAREPGQTLRSFDRSGFAAGVADQLIDLGVRCVIAAGWAVEDEPASLFATTFYQQLLSGQNFIAAVAAAREAAWALGGNTWAAYQCYGDPNWRFTEDPAAGSAANGIAEEYSAISSPLGLAIALEELAVKSRWQGARPAEQLQRARHLEARFAGLWGGMGAVAEAFGLACAEAGDRDAAIAWYERALKANDASASMKAAEQLGALRARRAGERAQDLQRGAPGLDDCRAELTQALRSLQTLAALQTTCERQTLVGSTWKQLARLERLAGDADGGQASMSKAIEAYRAAEALAQAAGDPLLFYPALNRMALELVINAAQRNGPGFPTAETEAVRRCLQSRMGDDADFWSLVGLVNIDVYCAVADRRLAAHAPAATAGFADLHNRVPSPHLWASVADQAELVLGSYADAAEAAEAAAARGLIGTLNGYATG